LGRGKSYLELNEPEKAKADFEQIREVTEILHLRHQAEELINKLNVPLKQETV
jgi:hypothetical protein